MTVGLRTAHSQQLLRVLDEREEGLAILLERPRGAEALLRLCDGTPRRLGRVGTTTKPVIRVQLKRGVPGETLDIQLRDADSAMVGRVLYRCPAILGQASIEVTPRDYPATWQAAELVAAYAQRSRQPKSAGQVKGSKTPRAVSTPKQPSGATCRVCGRRKLSRDEYNWRRRNRYAVWRCQHRKPNPSQRRGLVQAGGLIAGLVVCLCLL
jgi:hypothetical protein